MARFVIVSKTYTKEEKQQMRKQGLFVYELRGNDGSVDADSLIATIEPKVWVNNVGSLIADKTIDFGDFGWYDYDYWADNNDYDNEILKQIEY
jgi:hypothetical protein